MTLETQRGPVGTWVRRWVLHHEVMRAVGIDVAEERTGLDLVALDENRDIVDSAGGLTVAGCVERCAGADIVCVDGPSGWAHEGRSRASERGLTDCARGG